jgi:hypothetical protein
MRAVGGLTGVSIRNTGYHVAKQQDPVMVSLRLEGEDAQLLTALIEAERLSRSDVVRRAIRAYAAQLGVGPKPRPKPKR